MESQQQIKTTTELTNSGAEEKKEDDVQEIEEVSFFRMFRFADKYDIILMIVGSLAAAAMGTAFPAFAYIWGRMIDSFSDPDQMVNRTREMFLIFIYVGIGAFFAGLLMFACWMITGERQGIACRKAYLRSLLRQEIGWFDVINQTELSSTFASDTFAFQGALGEKISSIVMTVSTLIAGFAFAFSVGWLMSLVMLASIPALGISGFFYMSVITNKDKVSKKKYHAAGGSAEQAISAIKTVKQLIGEEYETRKYEKFLEAATKDSGKYGIYAGLGIGSIFFVMLATYALGFWFGSKCVLGEPNCLNQNYTAGDVLIVFFSIIMGGFNLSQLTPAFKKIAEGRQAASRIFKIIDRKPEIENPPNGIRIENLKGVFRFEKVTFAYPKDPSHFIFKEFSIEFTPFKNGLVGESGCGKSTVLQLLMRFYDPLDGRVTLDGYDLRELDLFWLREQFGYVGQEPVLFATTIKQNLLFGSEGASDDDIRNALDKAEAQFVYDLEKGIETYVGYGGGQLSGGQKQRIAIARAILRKPKILLLDEATSALDRRNERLIQATLDEISENRTTMTVAHRVSTIRKSDRIFVFEKGGVKEQGKFEELGHFKDFEDIEEEEVIETRDEVIAEHKDKTNKNKAQGYLNFEMDQKKNDDYFKTEKEIEAEHQKKNKKKYQKQIFKRIFAYSKGKIPFFVLGLIFALLNGTIFPIFSIFIARMLASLIVVEIDPSNLQEIANINNYALAFFLLGIGAIIFSTIQIASFSVVGEEITKKIRKQTYHKILKMPVYWFDDPRNNAGTLTARLSVDAEQINSLTTTIVSITAQNISTLLAGVIIALAHEWRTALVAIGLLPLMIISGLIQMKFHTGFSDKTDVAYKDSSNLIMEAMINIRTVSSFGYENVIANNYDRKLALPASLAKQRGFFSGLFFGISQFVMFTIFGLLFFLGSIFVRDNVEVGISDMFVAIFGILFAGMTAGNNAHFMPDAAAAENSAANLFEIQDSTDEDQIQVIEKSKMMRDGFEGVIELNNVDFRYESRNEYVFKGMCIQIRMGEKAAFVGTSGCGKSTIIQLLQRFYEPERGKITIGGTNIRDFDIHYLRSQFGVVSQEPVLFNGSFKENIIYNLEGVKDNELEDAAYRANALSFITGSEKIIEIDEKNTTTGFDRNVGVKGSHISGGQKQRVSIARAIIRKPAILLLDEATSALDSANQKIVQQSLDQIMQNRTTITVAHRIQTIKNSNMIYVFEKGKIVESGTYSDLVEKKGYFYNL